MIAEHVVTDITVLMVPGWAGSGPLHWQTIWERRYPDCRRIALMDWRSVDRADWVAAVERSFLSFSGEVVLVAHSLGCLAVAWWASSRFSSRQRVRGAMLVAPPDLGAAPGRLPALASFLPVPPGKLPFPSVVVASENDPYATAEATASMADGWGSRFVNAGAAGHINVDSGHGQWPEGHRYLQRLIANFEPSAGGNNRVMAEAARGRQM
jgi:predicted alpha/beta hydrolase family esterase